MQIWNDFIKAVGKTISLFLFVMITHKHLALKNSMETRMYKHH